MKNSDVPITPSYEAMALAMQSGIPPYLDGCFYVARAADIYAEGTMSFMSIYRIIGNDCGIKPKSVMRSIAYAISQAPDIHIKLSKMFDTSVPENLVHNGLVISFFGLRLRHRKNADDAPEQPSKSADK